MTSNNQQLRNMNMNKLSECVTSDEALFLVSNIVNDDVNVALLMEYENDNVPNSYEIITMDDITEIIDSDELINISDGDYRQDLRIFQRLFLHDIINRNQKLINIYSFKACLFTYHEHIILRARKRQLYYKRVNVHELLNNNNDLNYELNERYAEEIGELSKIDDSKDITRILNTEEDLRNIITNINNLNSYYDIEITDRDEEIKGHLENVLKHKREYEKHLFNEATEILQKEGVPNDILKHVLKKYMIKETFDLEDFTNYFNDMGFGFELNSDEE